MDTWKFIVYGKVQGVGYRNAVDQYVNNDTVDIGGYVRNLPNGTVEVIVQGERDQLRKIEEFLYQGSSFSEVDHLEKIELFDEERFDPFHINY